MSVFPQNQEELIVDEASRLWLQRTGRLLLVPSQTLHVCHFVLLLSRGLPRHSPCSPGHPPPLLWPERVVGHEWEVTAEREVAQPPCLPFTSFSLLVAEVARAGPHSDTFLLLPRDHGVRTASGFGPSQPSLSPVVNPRSPASFALEFGTQAGFTIGYYTCGCPGTGAL